MDVVLASRNSGKLDELDDLLAPQGWTLHLLSEFTDEVVAETALSFVENALIKARHAVRVSGLPAVADDSGLEVAALDGAPGVRSARFAGEHASAVDNNQKLLAALSQVEDGRRGARYVCAMVFLRHPKDATPVVAYGQWRGRILNSPRGQGGFGYDPLFYIDDLGMSAAELLPAVKNRLSHRGRAAQHLLSLLYDCRA